ncbi:hypothetical protein SVIOM74S_03659 [Streptomyces violarus]
MVRAALVLLVERESDIEVVASTGVGSELFWMKFWSTAPT